MSSPRTDRAKAQGAISESAGSRPGETTTSTHAHAARRSRGPRRATEQRDASRASSPDEAETNYVAARDAWTAAMRASASGRPADLAALAIAQEAYEAAAAERTHWAAIGPVAIPVDTSASRRSLDIVVGQEAEWRRVKDRDPDGGFIGRVKRLFGG